MDIGGRSLARQGAQSVGQRARAMSLGCSRYERCSLLCNACMSSWRRHATALCESLATRIVASDEKYADLPKRVSRLEAAVFAPKPR